MTREQLDQWMRNLVSTLVSRGCYVRIIRYPFRQWGGQPAEIAVVAVYRHATQSGFLDIAHSVREYLQPPEKFADRLLSLAPRSFEQWDEEFRTALESYLSVANVTVLTASP